MAGQIVPRYDSGYGWLVTFACFSVCFIMQGFSRASGILYVAIIDTYGVSREAATTPFSLRYGVRNMFGPIVGIVAQRFGMRTAVAIGGILASIGGALCAIAPDVTWITILWGVVHGIGYGLCSTIHILILNQYFDKYKATSIALALTGDCFGTFVFPTLLEFLLLNYGVDGTFLILGAISLNVVPAGLLMRAPDWAKSLDTEKKVVSGTFSNSNISGTENKAFDASDIYISNLHSNDLQKVAIPKQIIMSNLRTSSVKGYYFNNVSNNFGSKSFSFFDADKQKEVQREILSSECGDADKDSKNRTTRRRLGSLFPPSSSVENKNHSLLGKECVENLGTVIILSDQTESLGKSVCNVRQTKEENGTTQKNDIIAASEIENSGQVDETQHLTEVVLQPVAIREEDYPASGELPTKRKDSLLDKILSIPATVISEIQNYKPLEETQLDQNNTRISKTVSPQLKTKLDNNSAPSGNLTFPMRKYSFNKLNPISTECNRDNTSPVALTEESNLPGNTVISVNHQNRQVAVKKSANALRQFLSLNIRPLMIVIGISLAAYSFLLIAVFTIIVDYATDKGIDADQSKYLIISFSVADLFGRIGFGLILDKRWIKLSFYSMVNMAVMGISVLIIPFSSNYWYMMSCMAMFGLMQGGNAIVYPLLVEEYMNKDEGNVALGCLNLYGGLIMLPLAPIIGFFRDTIGNYEGVFYTVGGLSLFAALLWTLEPSMLHLHHRMSKKAMM